MTGDGNFKWYFARHEDSEVWSGSEPTREGAISAGTLEFAGDPFVIFEADKSVCGPNFNADWMAERLIEDIAEHNEECWGEDGWEDDAWSDEARKDLEQSLEQMVTEWLKRHPAKTWAAGSIRVTEKITP